MLGNKAISHCVDAFSRFVICSPPHILIKLALQSKHPSIQWDSRPFWVTARLEMSLTPTEFAEAGTQHELNKCQRQLTIPLESVFSIRDLQLLK